MIKVRLYLAGEKGLHVLSELISANLTLLIDSVVGAKDQNVRDDKFEEIRNICSSAGIEFYTAKNVPHFNNSHALAIGWRYLISEESNLIVLHDSLLPKYRGFNPLVTALINGDSEVGVTALFAAEAYDTGDIIIQKKTSITYPLKIFQCILLVNELYSAITLEILQSLKKGETLIARKQDESLASFSLWRDELDYFIDWTLDAWTIARSVDALGMPYDGAQVYVNNVRARLMDSVPLDDVEIGNRVCGKVLYMDGDYPIVVCGKGLLKIKKLESYVSGDNLLPLKKFRTRFTGYKQDEH